MNDSQQTSDGDKMKQVIQALIKTMMDRVLDKVLVKDPFVPDKHHATKPLYAALVPDEIFKGSHFERRFVTPFGKIWEQLAAEVAKVALGVGVVGHSITGTVREGRLRRVQEILRDLEHPKDGGKRKEPQWDRELKYVLKGKGEEIPVTVMCDVYAEDTANNKRYAFELKAPLPNSDQTKVSKEKLLKLSSMETPQVDEAYFALPYNPYGRRDDYDWSFPARWFDMKADRVVLIGDEFWDKIGGQGTYQSFVSSVNELGPAYRRQIYREFLQMEPPPSVEDIRL
jgi:hypothetical protein